MIKVNFKGGKKTLCPYIRLEDFVDSIVSNFQIPKEKIPEMILKVKDNEKGITELTEETYGEFINSNKKNLEVTFKSEENIPEEKPKEIIEDNPFDVPEDNKIEEPLNKPEDNVPFDFEDIIVDDIPKDIPKDNLEEIPKDIPKVSPENFQRENTGIIEKNEDKPIVDLIGNQLITKKEIGDIVLNNFKDLEKIVSECVNECSKISSSKIGKIPLKEDNQIEEWNICNAIHFVKCDKCRTINIKGIRYKCAICENYNLCQNCEEVWSSTHGHPFYKLYYNIEE